MHKSKKQPKKIPRGMVYDKAISDHDRSMKQFIAVLVEGEWVETDSQGKIKGMIQP